MKKTSIILPVILVLLFAATNVSAQKPASIYCKKDMEDNRQKECLVYGTYKTMMLPTSAHPGSPVVESSRIVIVLSDSTELALEVQDLGYRDEAEKEKFLGCQVLVSGTLSRWTQLWGTPEESAIIMDAIVDIQSIELIKGR
ncbi:MAG: hypothetical protein KKA07_01235 [Bacteroidetes bacterium]|nr:hypothetical protein [Bacteroidota bacterium]MBU1717672.1 hypothetical protein [Bacteroidota bacterium]